MNLRTKFKILVAIAAVGLLALAVMWLQSVRSNLLAERMQKTRSMMDLAYSLVDEQYKLQNSGQLSQDEAQKRALSLVGSLRYEGSNYFWINDTHPTMVMHPMKPALDGKDLTDYKDPTGKALFVEMVSAAAKDPSGGFVYYMWPKPGSDKPLQKLSFVRPFEPWGWIIGTGIYIDDLDSTWFEIAIVAGSLTLVCLLLLLITSTHVSRSIFTRLEDMVVRMKDVAEGEGDLTKRLDVHSTDEVADVARWFNIFMDKLQETVSEVSRHSQSLAAAGEQITSSARRESDGVEVQRDQTTQLAAAMHEMAATIHEISDSCNSAADASINATEAARGGGKIVEETLGRMRTIAGSVGETARKIQDLGKRSEEIGRIISVIDEIADQTNLLALNAAIEAARAGDQGRGFAVVADEVRKLAERTSSATKEITEMIGAVQAETKSAVSGMESGSREVQQGVESTSQAGDSLQDIIRMTGKVGDMISHIATAATEQAAAAEKINGNMDQIAQISESSASTARQTTDALACLSTLAANLQSLVGQFRVGTEPAGGAPQVSARGFLAPGSGSEASPSVAFPSPFANARGSRSQPRRQASAADETTFAPEDSVDEPYEVGKV
ncbi:MAG TPA: methyl-accepting chemotaxis protein [Candidatus Micrarchaeaceae archaeon]|nr:methyl-accepting chemotaxis protein [Candidatus Micrarchaeaceae archaeon]